MLYQYIDAFLMLNIGIMQKIPSIFLNFKLLNKLCSSNLTEGRSFPRKVWIGTSYEIVSWGGRARIS